MQKYKRFLLYSLFIFGFAQVCMAENSASNERAASADCERQAKDNGFKTKTEIAEFLL